MSQSATSHALARLRVLFDDRLLVPSGKRLRPTPRAERLLPQLERAVAELEGVLRAEPEFEPRRARRRFRIGMGDYAQALVLEPLLARVRAEAPHVDLAINGAANAIELVESGELDLAFTVPSSGAAHLVIERLFVERFVCMVRKRHPDVRGDLDLDTYLSLGHLLVAPSGTPGSLVDTELERRGLRRRIALNVQSFLIVPFIISGSDLVNTGPERLARRMARLLPIKIFAPPLKLPNFELLLCHHQRLANDPAHRWIVSVVRDVCQTV